MLCSECLFFKTARFPAPKPKDNCLLCVGLVNGVVFIH